WLNATNAATKNGSCAVTGGTGVLSLSNYGLAIPADATITGVQVKTWVTQDSFTTAVGLTLFGAGGSSTMRTVSPAAGNGSGCGTQSQTSGGDGDLWGLTLQPDDVNSSAVGGFGVQVKSNNGGSFAFRLDAVEITVFYFVPPAAPTG